MDIRAQARILEIDLDNAPHLRMREHFAVRRRLRFSSPLTPDFGSGLRAQLRRLRL
jgi:hypothetical protein